MLVLNHEACHTVVWEMTDIILTSTVDGGEWSAASPKRFIPEERAPEVTGSDPDGPISSQKRVSKSRVQPL